MPCSIPFVLPLPHAAAAAAAFFAAKKPGHNKRSCKKMTTPVSAPKIEAETDLKVIPPVKVEPEMSSESVHNMLIRINICKSSGIDADCNGAKTKQIGGGEGDGKIMGIPIEIKTAHQGSSSPSFQHELGEVPWKGGKYMIFVDIAPECIYLTIFKNFAEAVYKRKEKLLPFFPTKTATWRKEKGAFKLDTSVKINEANVANGHAIKITQTTPTDSIGCFIKKVIV
jgi:hypothetical protein